MDTSNATPNVDAIAGYAGKNMGKIIGQILNGLDLAEDVTVVRGVKADRQLTKLTVKNGFRPFDSNVEDGNKDDLAYSGRTLSPKRGMRVLHIDTEKYRDTYMSEMLDPANPHKIPFAEFVWKKVVEKVQSELNDTTAYFGVHNATGDSAIDVADGYGTLLAADILAGKVVPVQTGALTESNAVAAFTKVYKSLPAPLKGKPKAKGGKLTGAKTRAYCSFDAYEKYIEDHTERFGKFTGSEDAVYLKGSAKSCQLWPVSWMGDSQRIIITPKSNMLFGTNRLSDLSKISTKKNLWTVIAGISALLCFQYADEEAIAVNDQA